MAKGRLLLLISGFEPKWSDPGVMLSALCHGYIYVYKQAEVGSEQKTVFIKSDREPRNQMAGIKCSKLPKRGQWRGALNLSTD